MLALFANNLYQNSLPSPAVKFAIENLLPRSKVELPFGNSHDDFAAHELSFHVRVRIVLAGAIVLVLRSRFMRRELLQPDIIVIQQPVLRIIDVNTRGNVHGVDEAQTFLHAAFADEFLDRVGDVQIIAPVRRFKPEMFSKRFHIGENEW